MFSWEVDDPVLASVEENDDGSGATIMGARRGNTKIILKAADRGIKIEIPLRVQNEVKGIVLRNDMEDEGAKGSDVTVNKGTNPQVTATAYDAKNEEDGTNEGNAVSGVKFTWTTSNSSVATVDTEDSNVSPIIKTHAAGSAEIQAKIGDVKSNKIKVTVFTTEEPERRLIVSTANAPFTRYYDTDLNDDQTADDPILSASADTTDNTEANITITVTLQHRVLDTTATSDTFGELVWRVVADDAALDIAVSSSDTDSLDSSCYYRDWFRRSRYVDHKRGSCCYWQWQGIEGRSGFRYLRRDLFECQARQGRVQGESRRRRLNIGIIRVP